ncbi:hypothetical protein FGIG_02098 [Fasciola gigantica]|uniref:Autophagy-related protein 9 n=1 Tax=Fasciola gigantica TaxID=46835 RepID=A0A504YJX4_FASGI|nr:hypothetical protein FGIG_02098 [Fasciola gigantica]
MTKGTELDSMPIQSTPTDAENDEFCGLLQEYGADRLPSNDLAIVHPEKCPCRTKSLVPPKSMAWIEKVTMDGFLSSAYHYHHTGGFTIFLVSEMLWLLKCLGVFLLSIQFTVCTHWEVIFNKSASVTYWTDVLDTPSVCWAHVSPIHYVLVTLMILAALIKLVHFGVKFRQYWYMRQFYLNILNFTKPSTDMVDWTWSEVQRRLLLAQFHFPKHLKAYEMNEIQLHQILLRQENYLVSMVDHNVLPTFSLTLPFTKFCPRFFSTVYVTNIRLLLFHLPWSPFKHGANLKKEYLALEMHHRLTRKLAISSIGLGLANLIGLPVIFLFRLVTVLCANAGRFRFEPASFFGYQWSNYSRYRLRLYNELPHQFALRMTESYEPLARFMNCFVSKSQVLVIQAISFLIGIPVLISMLIGAIHSDLAGLRGFWILVLAGGLLLRFLISKVPERLEIASPQALLVPVVAKIQFYSKDWIENSASLRVRRELSQLFQPRLFSVLEDLVSPFVTPILLVFALPSRASEIIYFVRNNSVRLAEVGIVCNFSRLDIGECSDPNWIPVGDTKHGSSSPSTPKNICDEEISNYCGKIHASVLNFHMNNPRSELPSKSRKMLENIGRQLKWELTTIGEKSVQKSTLGGCCEPINQTTILGTTQTDVFGELFQSIYADITSGKQDRGKVKNASILPGPLHQTGTLISFNTDSESSADMFTTANSMPRLVEKSEVSDKYEQGHLASPYIAPTVGPCALNTSFNPFLSYSTDAQGRHNNLWNSAFGLHRTAQRIPPGIMDNVERCGLYMFELSIRNKRMTQTKHSLPCTPSKTVIQVAPQCSGTSRGVLPSRIHAKSEGDE